MVRRWIGGAFLLVLLVLLVLEWRACQPAHDSIAVENRTTEAVLFVVSRPYGERRYLVPACGRVVFDPRDPGTFDLASPPPPGATVERGDVYLLPDAAVVETIVIASDKVWHPQLGSSPTVPACEGSPPSTSGTP